MDTLYATITDDVNRQNDQFSRQIGILSIVIFLIPVLTILVAIATHAYIRRSIIYRILALEKSMYGYTKGRPLPIPTSGNDEITSMAESVSYFIDKRNEYEMSLKHAKETAEESKLVAEAANRAKSSFLANMSHELRTPLNAILGFSGMLAREKNATSDQQQKLSIINRSGQHLLSMINDVLVLSKIEAGSMELQEHPFDLVALIKEISVMIQSRATEKGLSVAVEAETTSFPYVKADAGKLRQILINLLGNAVKFTDEGGVTIRSATEAIPEAPNRCHMVIEVEDTGPGIDPARQDKIFEPFVQGIDKPVRKGTGLGLSICKKYAEFMGGTIELESEVGKGSLFRLRLPAKITETADVKTSVDDKPRVIGLAPGQKTWRILVADDNQANLLLMKSLLESVGFFVLEAKNGQEALEAFKKESPDFIWMDMRMPVMDGYEATMRIRKWEGEKMNSEFGIRKVEGAREEAEKMGRWEGENKSEIRNPKWKGYPSLRSLPALFASSAMRYWRQAATTWLSNRFRRTRSLRRWAGFWILNISMSRKAKQHRPGCLK